MATLLAPLAVAVGPAAGLRLDCPLLSLNASLVFDFEADDDKHGDARNMRPGTSLSAVKERLEFFCKPSGEYALKLANDVKYFQKCLLKEQADREHQQADTVVLASRLANVGYNVVVRTAIGGGAACFRNLRHEFLTVRADGDYEGVEYIVEPRFREQFQIPHPTEQYKAVLRSVPEVYVGTSARLVPVIQVLCCEMAESFDSKGLTLPPWRKTQSMLSKWMPTKAKDTAVSSPPSASHASYSPKTCEGCSTAVVSGRSALRSLLSVKLQSCGNSPVAGSISPPNHWGEMPIHKVKIGFAPLQEQH